MEVNQMEIKNNHDFFCVIFFNEEFEVENGRGNVDVEWDDEWTKKNFF